MIEGGTKRLSTGPRPLAKEILKARREAEFEEREDLRSTENDEDRSMVCETLHFSS